MFLLVCVNWDVFVRKGVCAFLTRMVCFCKFFKSSFWEKKEKEFSSGPDMENMRFSNNSNKMFQFLHKELGRSSIDHTFSIESCKTDVVICGMFMTLSMKAVIHL